MMSQIPVVSGDYWPVMFDNGSDEFGAAAIESLAENMAEMILK